MLDSTRYNRGFIALLSSLIISMVLIAVSFTLSDKQFFLRSNSLGAEFKGQSYRLAVSCLYASLERILYDYSYTDSGVVIVHDSSCLIKSITQGPEDVLTHRRIVTIETGAGYMNSYSSIKAKVSVQNPSFAQGNPGTPQIQIVSLVAM